MLLAIRGSRAYDDRLLASSTRYLAPFVSLLLIAGCDDSEPPAKFEPVCSLNAFRACELDACRGVQQCVEPGVWSQCACTITDASFADVASDAVSDAEPPTDAPDGS